MKKSVIRNYAKLVVRKGLNIQKGQPVVINADLDQPEFVNYCVEECYKAGASKVDVNFSYLPVIKTRYKKESLKNLCNIEDWKVERMKHYCDVLPAFLHIESSDPDGLKGIDQEKMGKSQIASYKVMKKYRDEMENKYQWCIAAVPGKIWAKKVFPDLPVGKAVEKLWEAILYCSRADGADPVDAWNKHNEDLRFRCEYINNLGLTELRYKSKNGTDFKVGLIDDGIFAGGSEYVMGKDVEFNPNIPSEEVFTSPKRGVAEGIVYATRPLSFRGELIENFSIRFEGGKAVEVKAERNEELLKQMISMDEGAAYLGECALVPYDSPIRNSEITFFNTLFDENACCHLALGRGFTNCLRDYEKYSNEECKDRGINDSMIHVDFMIGSEDLSIDGVTKDGKITPLFRDGNWAF